jgi:arylsulfatase A-like enzyme
VDDRLIDMIDLTATTLSIAGIRKPAGMQGRVFLGEAADAPREYAFGARDRCDETTFRFRTARDARYRYIRNFTPDRPFLQANDYKERSYPVWNLIKELNAQGKLDPVQAALAAPAMPPEELFDLDADPYEIKNLATSPAHQAVLKRLRAALEKWIEDTNDQGRIPEPPDVAARKGATKPAAVPDADAKAAKKKKNAAPRQQ